MTKQKYRQSRERDRAVNLYLKIPCHILNLRGVGLSKEMLLAHIYSFGAKGCWESNQTLGETFMVLPRTIPRWLRAIKEYIIVQNPKGYYRTIWAKPHPDVKDDKIGMDGRQKRDSDYDKNGVRLRINCHSTINTTITKNNKRTTASPSPLPAGGQAPATLRHRTRAAAEEIERFKARFGHTAGFTPLTPTELERRRAEQLAALRATNEGAGTSNNV